MKTTTRTPRNSSAARAPKQAATQSAPAPASPELSSRQRAALCNMAVLHGRLSPDAMRAVAESIQDNADEAHEAARTLALNPAAWDLAGASDPAVFTKAELAEQAAILQPDSASTPSGRFKGLVEWWNPGMGMGVIDPTGFKQPPIPLRRGEQLVFRSADLRGFDPHRLNETDEVEFSLEQTKDGLRAVNVEVTESVAENCEAGDTKPRTFAVKLEGGTAISGFTMAYADWQRLESAAVGWADATNDPRLCLEGFIEEAIKEKVARCSDAAGQAQADWRDTLDLIVSCGDDPMENCLFASRQGQLYLWSGALKYVPQAVSLTEAKDWWQKYHADEPGFSAPFFPERTAAAEFVLLVCNAMRNAASERVPDLETAIAQSFTIAHIMEQRITEGLGVNLPEPFKGSFELGLCALTQHVNEQLRGAFYDKNGGSRVVPLQDRRAA